MTVELGETKRRGEFLAHEVHDLTRVGHPKTADVIELEGKLVIVPVSNSNPVAVRDTMNEAMSFVRRYVELNE